MKIANKKIGKEIDLFLICFLVSLFILWPLFMSMVKDFTFGEWESYTTLLKEIYDPLIFQKGKGISQGVVGWVLVISLWLLIQIGRFLIWLFCKIKTTLFSLIARKSENQIAWGFSVGFIVGVSLLGGIWLWTQNIGDPDDPYYSVTGTNPENWHNSDRDNTSWKAFDVKDCHQYVADTMSKEFLSWEKRLAYFRACMRDKGYEFKVPTK